MSNQATGALSSLLCHPRVSRMLNAINKASHVPALLFAGQTGVGKRTAALLLAQATNCEQSGCGRCHTCISIARLAHPDVRLVFPVRQGKETTPAGWGDALASEYPDYQLERPQPPLDQRAIISVELARWIRSESAKPPLVARRRYFVILHAHRLNTESAATLLKTFEETRPHTTFILCTDRPRLLPGTISSRCRVLRFAPVESTRIAQWLRSQAQSPADLISAAVRFAHGSPGEAIRYLEGHRRKPGLLSCAACSKVNISVLPSSCPLVSMQPSELTKELLLFYREVLRTRLGLEPSGETVGAPCPLLNIRHSAHMTAKLLRLLHNRQEDANLSTNPALTSYTLLWLLSRFSAAGAAQASPSQSQI